jgi:tetrahydromethanopterin S-methyltransferase subunit F
MSRAATRAFRTMLKGLPTPNLRMFKIDMPDININIAKKMSFPSSKSAADMVDLLKKYPGDNTLKNSLENIVKNADFPVNTRNLTDSLSSNVVETLGDSVQKNSKRLFSNTPTTKMDLGNGIKNVDVPTKKLEEATSFLKRNKKLAAGLGVLGISAAGIGLYSAITGESVGDVVNDLVSGGFDGWMKFMETLLAGTPLGDLWDFLGDAWDWIVWIMYFVLGAIVVGGLGYGLYWFYWFVSLMN